MFIAKNENLIILAKETREELEQALQFMVYTSIEETDVEYELCNGEYLTKEEIAQRKREYLDNLELTASDVERAIYEAKGMDFEDLVQFVIDSELVGFDVKRLKIELKANHFVRKHPYINMIGSMLGYTPDDMDYLFENKRFPIKEDNEQEIIENI